MNRLQEAAVERLCHANEGQLAIREGYLDHHVEVTSPRGASWKIREDGVPTLQHGDFSIDWSQ